jgi:thioredoxin-related protein
MKSGKFVIHVLLLIIFSSKCIAQKMGIAFEHGLTWEQILGKAEEEHKLIFLDCYTTWCGPCKFMNDSIFPVQQVGDYFNDKFISVQVQMDINTMDNNFVKYWYKDVERITQQYKIREFPSYLFFNAAGRLVHKAIGARNDWEEFITIAKDALSYTELVQQYNLGVNDDTFLKKIALAALAIDDTVISGPASRIYIKGMSDIYTKDNLFFIALATRSSYDMGFHLYMHNYRKINEIEGKGFSMHVFGEVINNEEIKPALGRGVSWNAIMTKVIRKYPEIGEEVVMLYHFSHDIDIGDWKNYGNDVMEYMKKYSDRNDDDAFFSNSLAWYAFLHTTDKSVLIAALQWVKLSIRIKETSYNLDTYASLLYKLGKTEKALLWECKAVSIAPQDNELKERLNKMKRREKIWLM